MVRKEAVQAAAAARQASGREGVSTVGKPRGQRGCNVRVRRADQREQAELPGLRGGGLTFMR